MADNLSEAECPWFDSVCVILIGISIRSQVKRGVLFHDHFLGCKRTLDEGVKLLEGINR